MPDPLFICIGSFLVLVFLFGFVENGLVLVTFLLYKRLRTVHHSFLVGLSLGNFLQVVLTLPQVIISSFTERWTSGHSGCVFNAFCMTMLGLSQIALLTVIAVERYLIIVRQVTFATKSFLTATVTICICYLFGTGWALGPLVGWSKYEMEAIGISCSVSWEMEDMNSFSYTLCLFTFAWFIPLILIAFSYLKIIYLVHREKARRRILIRRDRDRHNRSKEWKVSITVLLMVGAFVISWTPYSVVSLWSVFAGVSSLPIGAILAPAIIAKSSVVWNPVIYLWRNKDFREACWNTLLCCINAKSNTSTEVIHTNTNNDDNNKITNGNKSNVKKNSSSKYSVGFNTEADSILPEKCASEMVVFRDYTDSMSEKNKRILGNNERYTRQEMNQDCSV